MTVLYTGVPETLLGLMAGCLATPNPSERVMGVMKAQGVFKENPQWSHQRLPGRPEEASWVI